MGRGEDKSIFMYSQSDRFPLPVFMMGFWNSVQEQVTLFKQRKQKTVRGRSSVGEERS